MCLNGIWVSVIKGNTKTQHKSRWLRSWMQGLPCVLLAWKTVWRHKLTSTYWWRWVTLLHFQVTFASCRAAVLISLFTLYTLHPKSIICFTFSQSNQELLLFRVNTLYGGGNIRYMWVEKKKKEVNSTHYCQRKHGKEPDPGISWWVSETTRGVQSWT